MKIEVLYPEICCLFGDKANARYLQACMPEAEFVYTNLAEEPAFVKEDVAMIYIASMSEASQELMIEVLSAYKERLAQLIESGCVILATGNAFEIFGKSIYCVALYFGVSPTRKGVTTSSNRSITLDTVYLLVGYLTISVDIS